MDAEDIVRIESGVPDELIDKIEIIEDYWEDHIRHIKASVKIKPTIDRIKISITKTVGR